MDVITTAARRVMVPTNECVMVFLTGIRHRCTHVANSGGNRSLISCQLLRSIEYPLSGSNYYQPLLSPS